MFFGDILDIEKRHRICFVKTFRKHDMIDVIIYYVQTMNLFLQAYYFSILVIRNVPSISIGTINFNSQKSLRLI